MYVFGDLQNGHFYFKCKLNDKTLSLNANDAGGYDDGRSSLCACRKDNGNDNKQDVFNPWMSYHGLVSASPFSAFNDKTLATGIDAPIMIWQAPGIDDNIRSDICHARSLIIACVSADKRLRLFDVCCFDFYLLFFCCAFCIFS